MILHTLNLSPGSGALRDCLAAVSKGDALVLLGEGCYCALAGSEAAATLAACPADVYLLADDARALGLEARIAQFPAIDMAGLVALSERYPRQLAWY